MFEFFNQIVLAALMAATQGESSNLPTISTSHYQSIAIAEAFSPTDPSAVKNGSPRPPLTNLTVLENAFRHQTSNIQVLVLGRITAILPDDTNGDRHQRFIIRLSNSQTLLVAHNIDIAPRVSGLRVGDQVYVYGEYEWNSEGGVLHWTHHDPDRRHVDGWIQRNGRVFR